MIRKPDPFGNRVFDSPVGKPPFRAGKASLFGSVGKIVAFALLTFLPFFAGCKVGGGTNAADSSGPIAIEVAPVKVSSTGDADKDGLMASISGSGVTSAWLEDPTGQKIGPPLEFQNYSQKYQMLLVENTGGFSPGKYALQYTVGGETKKFQTESLDWTMSGFPSAPTLSWDGQSRGLHVNFPTVPGSNRYRLEGWNADTGSLIYLSAEGPETYIYNYLSLRATYQMRLIAGKYENGMLRAAAMFIWERTY